MAAALQPSGGGFQVPQISQKEIDSFHDAHFSNEAIELFDTQFLRPENTQDGDEDYKEYGEYYDEEEEDDGLGYYPDGVKRTLTDEQIEIFRHSELESLRRIEAKAAKLKQQSAALLQEAKDEDAAELKIDPEPTAALSSAPDGNHKEAKIEDETQEGSEDGEIETDKPEPTKAEARRVKKQRAKRKKHEQRKFIPEKKPDLRKRTWDVVEAGMDSLYYDDEAAGNAATAPAAQRRRISYED
ncbi:hypothetical protein F5Y04DRAFT_278204 [Hypomontagnella monticulosa]|nr:hypothetical protein F5Y04DRAFT_278204 [Hypomontagnella monticulosa]